MSGDPTRANRRWSEAVAEELARLGVETVALCPGSRNSPLALACMRHAGLRTPAHFDERGAGYFALGCAKAGGKPAAVLVTSGTAVANLHPAVMEADACGIPLLVLSADRPMELLGIGANQAVDQQRLFGAQVRHFAQLPCAEDPGMPGAGLAALDEAVWRAAALAGPVHVNFALREPLVDASWSEPLPAPDAVVDGALPPGYGSRRFLEWHAGGEPFVVRASLTPDHCAPAGAECLEELLTDGSRWILAVGSLEYESDRLAARRIAEALPVPVYADLLSGLRAGPLEGRVAFDRLARKALSRENKRDKVLHLGGRFISKPFEKWLSEHARVHVRVHPAVDRIDPALSVTHALCGPLGALAEWVSHRALRKLGGEAGGLAPASGTPTIRPDGRKKADEGGWKHFVESDTRLRARASQFTQKLPGLCELQLPAILTEALPEGALLFAGNSMPVRDLSSWAYGFRPGVTVLANRGASGIDGLVATAAGAAHASGKPTVLLLGDLSFLHDLGSLALLRALPEAFILLLVNNGGGGIFHFLQVEKAGEGFESHIALGHGWNLEAAPAIFGLAHRRVASKEELAQAIAGALAQKQKLILEMTTDRVENARQHRALDEALSGEPL